MCMKKIWMVMLFGIMLLMAKSNNVYAETYETDLSQYNVGDNILQTTFEINTDEACEYEIVESGTFHNGLSCRWQSMNLKIVCLDGEAMVRYSDVMEVFIM